MADVFQELKVVLTAETDKFTSGFDNAINTITKSQSKLTSTFNAIGGIAVAGAVAGVAGLTAVVKTSMDATVAWGEKLDSTMDIIGGTTEQSAGLNLMMDRIGGSSEQVTNAMAKMTQGLTTTSGEAGTSAIALQKLGLSAYDTNGNIKDAYQLFGEVGDKLADMPDGLDKTSIMMDIFGKSGKELGDALNAASNGGMKNFQEEAVNMGLAVDPAKIIEYEKAQRKLDKTFLGMQTTIGMAAIPAFQQLADTLSNKLADPKVQAFISDFAKGVADFTMTVVNHIPQAIQIFQNIVSFLQNNQGIIVGVLAVLTIAVVTFAVSSAVALWAMIAPLLVPIAIITAIIAVVALLYTAWTTNFGGIQEKTASVISWIKSAWQNFVNGIIIVWNIFVAIFKPLFEAFTAATKGNWYEFGAKLREYFDNAGKAIVLIASTLWEATKAKFKEGIDAIVNFFTTTDWGGVGRAIIEGIRNGISSMISSLVETAKSAAIAAYEAAKGFLKINSPSKLFAGLGSGMMEGMSMGIEDSTNLPVNMTLKATKATTEFASSSKSNSMGDLVVGNITITIQGNADKDTVSKGVFDGLLQAKRQVGLA